MKCVDQIKMNKVIKTKKTVTKARKKFNRILSICSGAFYFFCMRYALVYAKDIKEVTDGIDTIKSLVKGAVTGVGVIFLMWGILDFGTAYSAHDTSQQSAAIKKVIGGLVMVFIPQILNALGV